MAINTVLAVLVALSLKHRFAGRNFFRFVFYLPSVLSVTVVGIIAFRVWDPQGGLLNYVVTSVFNGQPINAWGSRGELLLLVQQKHSF